MAAEHASHPAEPNEAIAHVTAPISIPAPEPTKPQAPRGRLLAVRRGPGLAAPRGIGPRRTAPNRSPPRIARAISSKKYRRNHLILRRKIISKMAINLLI